MVSAHTGLEWLYENAGPVIRLRLICEFGVDAAEAPTREEVLELPETRYWLGQLAISERVHDGHPDALENIAGKLHELGLCGASDVLEPHLRDWRRRLADLADDTTFFAGNTRGMLLACFSLLGLADEDVLRVAKRRLDVLHRFCRQRDYDIYLPADAYRDLPRARAGKPLVDPRLYPDGKVMLPTIYDIIWFPLLYGEEHERIDAVVDYILDDRYQLGFREGYGNIRAGRRHYYSMGWSVHLPGFGGGPLAESQVLLLYLELLALFAPARRSTWFTEAMDTLTCFRTPAGTWRFPKQYLLEYGKRGGYYVLGYHMGLGENRRRRAALELESTFRMLRIPKLSGRL